MQSEKIGGLNPQEFKQMIAQELSQELRAGIKEYIKPLAQEFIKDMFTEMFIDNNSKKSANKNQVFNNKVNIPEKPQNKPNKAKTNRTNIYTPKDIKGIVSSKKILPDEKLISIFGNIPQFTKKTAKNKIEEFYRNISYNKQFFKEYKIISNGKVYNYIKSSVAIEVIYRLCIAQKLTKTKCRQIFNILKNMLKAKMLNLNGLKPNQVTNRNIKITNTIEVIDTKIKLLNAQLKN
jgi:hypothetical protein